MEITLTRKEFTEKSSIGDWAMDTNPFTCVTIEDPDRNLFQQTPVADILRAKQLHPDEVCIPYGRYEIAMTWSNRYGKIMPQILHVPGFDGIRVHIANKPGDVRGCVGVATYHRHEDFVDASGIAFNRLYKILADACAKEKVFITIQKAASV